LIKKKKKRETRDFNEKEKNSVNIFVLSKYSILMLIGIWNVFLGVFELK
jgi:hypothetical protein